MAAIASVSYVIVTLECIITGFTSLPSQDRKMQVGYNGNSALVAK